MFYSDADYKETMKQLLLQIVLYNFNVFEVRVASKLNYKIISTRQGLLNYFVSPDPESSAMKQNFYLNLQILVFSKPSPTNFPTFPTYSSHSTRSTPKS